MEVQLVLQNKFYTALQALRGELSRNKEEAAHELMTGILKVFFIIIHQWINYFPFYATRCLLCREVARQVFV